MSRTKSYVVTFSHVSQNAALNIVQQGLSCVCITRLGCLGNETRSAGACSDLREVIDDVYMYI